MQPSKVTVQSSNAKVKPSNYKVQPSSSKMNSSKKDDSPSSITSIPSILGYGKEKPVQKSPNILPKSLPEYYFDKYEDKVEPYKDYYKNIFYAPASEFAVLRQELACLDNRLVKARVAWRQERKSLMARWDRAIEKHRLVEENIPKFNGYYKDSFAKKERAIQQVVRERDQCEVKQKELRRLRKEKDRLQEIKNEQDNRLEKFSIFKMYLDNVKQSSQGEYGDVREIIDRFAVLAEARNNLTGKTDNVRENVQRRQKALERDILMKSNEVLAYRNFLSELLDYQQSLHEQVLRLEDNLIRIKTTAAQRTLIIGQIKMAIRNLYMQVCKHMHRNARITPEDTLGQLLDIRVSVREMYKLAKDIKHMLRQAYLTAEAEAAAREKQKQKNLERQRRLDKLGKRGIMDPRELFGLKRRDSGQQTKDKLQEMAFVPPANIMNATAEKAYEVGGEMQGVPPPTHAGPV